MSKSKSIPQYRSVEFTWNLWDNKSEYPQPPSEADFQTPQWRLKLESWLNSYGKDVKWLFQLQRGQGAEEKKVQALAAAAGAAWDAEATQGLKQLAEFVAATPVLNGRLHYQGYLRFPGTANTGTKTLACIGKAAHAAGLFGLSVRNTHSDQSFTSYILESKTNIAGPFRSANLEKVAAAEAKVSDAKERLKALYSVVIDKPNALQKLVFDLLSQPTSTRGIGWFYDKLGRAGKTWLVNALMLFKPEEIGVLSFIDTKHGIQAVNKQRDKKAYLFDLTRTKPSSFSMTDIYSLMEMCKGGRFTGAMYECDTWLQEPAHVFVFANFVPLLKSMSADHWNIYELRHSPADNDRVPFPIDIKSDEYRLLVNNLRNEAAEARAVARLEKEQEKTREDAYYMALKTGDKDMLLKLRMTDMNERCDPDELNTDDMEIIPSPKKKSRN